MFSSDRNATLAKIATESQDEDCACFWVAGIQYVVRNITVLLAVACMTGCSGESTIPNSYGGHAEKKLTFDLRDVKLREFPIVQSVGGYTLTIDGLIPKARKIESQETDNIYAFGLGKPGFTATLRLADRSGDQVSFFVQSISVSNNNQFNPGPEEPPRCPVYATGIRSGNEIYKDYMIGPSYGAAGQFNVFRFRQDGRIDTLVLKAEPTGEEYYPNFDDFVLLVDDVARR